MISPFKPVKQTARLSFVVSASTASELKKIEELARGSGRELAIDEALEAALKKLLAAARKELVLEQEAVAPKHPGSVPE